MGTYSARRVPTFGTWSTATSYTSAAFDFGFDAAEVRVSNLDAGYAYFTVESTAFTVSTGGLVTTSSGLYPGPHHILVSCGETVAVTGVFPSVAVAATSTGRFIRVMAFGQS